jgi:release factor glutamine methyltransferase
MKKKTVLKKILAPVLIPATQNYLGKARAAHFMNLQLHIPVGVFHPSFFFSTKTMAKWLLTQPLQHKKLLEIGCGSGALSIIAAQQGARVFCCDIHPAAIEATSLNAKKNQVALQVVQSNLFSNLGERDFNFIINNPPYYPKDPGNLEEKAWYAGRNHEYFTRLFKDAKPRLAVGGLLYLVLSDECNIELINQTAREAGFIPSLVYTRPTLIEKNFIFQYASGK